MNRKEVKWFAKQIEGQLQANDYKGGWDDCSIEYLFQKLVEEVGELAAILNGVREGNIIKESADIGACAMMIADHAFQYLDEEA